MSVPIRDFIYLDIERVRSFYAQLSKGLPTEHKVEKGAEVGLDSSIEGNVIFAKGQASADYRYIRSSSETSSLHDYIMEAFLEKLKNARRLIELPDSNFVWEQHEFQDGMLILAKGIIKILDHKYTVALLDNLPKLADSVNRIAGVSQQNKGANKNAITNALKGKPVKELAEFIDQNMRDALRLKVYLRHDTPSQHFLATANNSFFRYDPVSLITMYGPVIDADWLCLLQINRGNQHQLTATTIPEFPPLPTQFELMLEALADHLSNITKTLQGVEFPAVAATPIAIFREI